MDYYSKLQSRSSSSSSSSFPLHRTQIHSRMHYSTTSTISPKSSSSPQRYLLAVAALFILPFLLYLFVGARRTHLSPKFDAPTPKGFSILIDAGIHGSRVHVFEYLNGGRVPFVGIEGKGVVSLKVRPGLREFSKLDGVERAVSSLTQLLEFARRKVPRKEWGKTKVRLLETSGLNGVEVDVRNRIFESCRKVLRSSGFFFRDKWLVTITGQEKSVYAWVAANYALGTFGGDPQETKGIVEFDGDATQIAFISNEPPPIEFTHVIKLPGVSYILYTSSMHKINQKEAWDFFDNLHNSKTITSSSSVEVSMMSYCVPKGYTQTYNLSVQSTASNHELFADSSGNFSACRSNALSLLKEGQGICSNPPCGIISRFLPNFQGKDLNADNLFYMSELFGLVPRGSLKDLEAAGKNYCEDDWVKLRKDHFSTDEADLLKYCFSSAFIVALLHDGFGIPMDEKSIGIRERAVGHSLDWTLGAFILQMVEEPDLDYDLDHSSSDNVVTYITLFAVFFFVILTIFFVLRWQRPHFKMVYDLEKGHYIVTRMPRKAWKTTYNPLSSSPD